MTSGLTGEPALPELASPGPAHHGRTVAWGLVALGLVAIVAMEAHGAAWSSHRNATVHSLPHGVVVAAIVCLGLVGAVVIVAALIGARVVETPQQRRKRWTNAIAFLILILVISIARLAFHPTHHVSGGSTPVASSGGSRSGGSGGDGSGSSTTWWPLVIVGLGTAAALAAAMVRRPALDPEAGSDLDDETLALLDASLDDLRGEPDPRRAVVAAYARMERRLAARGFARQPWETPTEYLHRALTGGVHDVGVGPLRELTALAEQARFSALPVDEVMRTRAIDALEALRRELSAPAAAPTAPGPGR